ncbi:hypothetical protein [Paracoccus sp. (in: a-proteobacteria)]|uniref:hypothetical protein n=1 Tax=Paracoccus sp. TaxID=267 RepID=UPI002AFF4053|nr:hypothetical protein [Paracoccus sp. (in: a-proteobacteria)]
MTHHDKARELAEKLRQWDGCWPAPGLERDVEAAADLITALAEENRRLREALEPFASSWKIAQASGLTDMSRLGAIARNETAAIWFMRAFSALNSTGEKG